MRCVARGTHNETRVRLREAVRTMLRRDVTTAREAAHVIMYLEQEVEKIRQFVVINNPRLLAEQPRIPTTPTAV